MSGLALTRREFLAGGGALVVSFALSPRAAAQAGETATRSAEAKLPGSLDRFPMLDSWIGVGGDGTITVFTGKAELGQGIRTALGQLAAEELGVPFERITLVTADTARTPDEGYTAGSNSMKDSGTAIVNAAAQVRALLVEEAAKKWNVAPNTLGVKDGVVTAADGRRLEFRELVAGQALHVRASAQSVRAKTRNDRRCPAWTFPEGYRWRCYTGLAIAGNGPCARGAPAAVRREARISRHFERRAHAGAASRRA
jgi:CO/xanthine dehydrogenase Mo-binding subunit